MISQGAGSDAPPLGVRMRPLSDLGTYELWTIINQSGMGHPFHEHVNAAQVLSISGADSSYSPYASMPAWKGTT